MKGPAPAPRRRPAPAGGGGLLAGLDIGSRSLELVLMQEGELLDYRRLPTTYDPLGQCRRILEGLKWDRLVATGYGRELAANHLDCDTLTEIQAHALGARHLFPHCRGVLDIGGQDTKAMALSPQGRVVKFEMNDRCAAGTGKFLEFMATGLQVPLEEFGRFALEGAPGVEINSMCTVFAESEATSLMARGRPPADIALALHRAVIKRALAMLRRVGVSPPVVFSGGAALNRCLVELLRREFEGEVLVPPRPEAVGALGAALFAGRD